MQHQQESSTQLCIVVDQVRAASTDPYPANYDYLTLWRIIFGAKLKSASSCWEWQLAYQGSRHKYGVLSYKGKRRKVTRLILYFTQGFDLDGNLLALHHCDNPICVNPDHLYAGTYSDNVRDAKLRGRESYGERHKTAKLTDAQVKRLREDAKNGLSSYQLGRKYKIHNAYAWRLVTGKRRLR